MNGKLLLRGHIETYPFRIPMPLPARVALIKTGIKVGGQVLRYASAGIGYFSLVWNIGQGLNRPQAALRPRQIPAGRSGPGRFVVLATPATVGHRVAWTSRRTSARPWGRSAMART
jgi:hypothetical protein